MIVAIGKQAIYNHPDYCWVSKETFMAKRASKILSWDWPSQGYILDDQEKSSEIVVNGKGQTPLEWLETQTAFAFQGKNGRLNLQKETRSRSQAGYWYAYQRQGQRMVKQYLGRSSTVTIEQLENAAQKLASKASNVADEMPPSEAEKAHSLTLSKLPTDLPITASLSPTSTLVLQSPELMLEPKLRLPRLHNSLVARPRLLNRLDEGLERKLTLVSAPAGFGKTTLVRQWLADRYEIYPTTGNIVPKIAWVSLDPGDNDPVRFWRYIITACQASGFLNGQTALEQLITPLQPAYHPVALQVVLVSILNELTRLDGLNLLILEDYHVITSPQLHETLTFFLENLPPSFHLVIITRHDPPLPLARLRGQGELNEIQQADLRFSSQETWDFLQENSSYQFSQETVRQLDQRLEGWAVGLRLLLVALQSSQTQPRFEQLLHTFAGSHRPIQDYFVTEVLDVLPTALQNFILQTSVLERLTPALCAALTGEADSEKWLETLARSNLFLEPLDDSGEWYRYHALFAGAMQQEVRRRFGADTLAELYNRASGWFEQNGLFSDAVETALRANNFEQAARLIEKIVANDHFLVGLHSFKELNEFNTLSRWLKELPTPILRQHPLLCLNYASALFFIFFLEFLVIPPAALAQLQEALDWAAEGWQAQSQRGQLVQVFVFRALLSSMTGDLDKAVAWAKQAEADLPEEEQSWRGMVLHILGTYELYDGQLDRAKRYLNEARVNTDALGNHNFMRANMSLLAWIYREQGELHQADEYMRPVLAEARDLNDKDDIIHSLLGLTELSYEWNDLETTWQQAQELLDLVSHLPVDVSWAQANLIQARILHARGQTAQALQRLHSVLSLIKPPESVLNYQCHREIRLWQARFYLDSGNLAGFEHWVNTLAPVENGVVGKEFEVYSVQRANEILLLSRRFTEQGEWSKALSLLEPLLTEMEAASRFRYAMKIRLNMALALAAGKKLPAARQLLQVVLSQAHIEGFMRLFLDEGEPLAKLLRATPLPIGGKALNLYRQTILAAFDQFRPAAQATSAHEPLSPQEGRVLALLEAGLSYPEIARQLVVSVNTIKTQVKSIYQKLNVNNRQQATEAARQLKSH